LALAPLCVAGAVVLVVAAGANPFADVLAVVLLLLAFLMRPRLGKIDEDALVLSPADAPEVYALVDDVAAALSSRSADVIVVDERFNASWGVVGLRRRRVLTLGLPLLAALEPQQQVSLLAHEVGHERNGDVGRTFVVSTALNALAELVVLFSPDFDEGGREMGAFGDVATAVMRIFSLPFWGMLLGLWMLVLRDSQRAEYLADALAAHVAGTAAEIASQEALLLGPALDARLQRAMAEHRYDGADSIAVLRAAARDVPPGERERRRRVARLEGVALDATHPPTGRRIALLERRPPAEPTLTISGERAATIALELRGPEVVIGRLLVDRRRGGQRL
jgi:Zn-dependent protease with chaperone function